MNRIIILIAMLLLSAFTSFSQTDAVRLPGEDGRIPALSPYPFPDRLTAYVWRNWGLVDASVLEATIGAPSGRLAKIAMEMGLPRDPEVLPEWKTKGYITILRRNWHLLPYDQLLSILGKSRRELYFCLMEDDFLWVKLGSIKPFCPRLEYSEKEELSGKIWGHTLRGSDIS